MKGGGGMAPVEGGDQFPPLESLPDEMGSLEPAPGDAMSRLTDRINAPNESGQSRNEGFEASIHRIKEQVLPRLLERVDPKRRRRSARTNWPRNSARSSARCWPS
jgi:pilus assembly protein CpaF